MNIYVGNLSYDVDENQLRKSFEQYGDVASVNIIKDKYSGQSKGFGFVEINDDDKALQAIEGLNEKELGGRKMNVNQAKPRTDNRGGGGGGRGGFGGGGGGRRY